MTYFLKSLLVGYLVIFSLPLVKIALTSGTFREKDLPAIIINAASSKEYLDPIIRLNNENAEFFCTAYVINDQYAITAAHCVVEGFLDTPKKNILVKDRYGREAGEAKVAAFNQRLDTGLIIGDFSEFKKINVETNYSKLRETQASGKPLVSCGYPMNSTELFCVPAIIEAFENFHVTSYVSGLLPGMSGGPLIDPETNTAIGINSYVNGPASAFATTISIFESFGLTVVK